MPKAKLNIDHDNKQAMCCGTILGKIECVKIPKQDRSKKKNAQKVNEKSKNRSKESFEGKMQCVTCNSIYSNSYESNNQVTSVEFTCKVSGNIVKAEHADINVSADILPTNSMTDWIESHLHKQFGGKDIGQIWIRCILNHDNEWSEDERVAKYRKKSILAFHVLNEVEILFFAFEVAEFRSKESRDDKNVYLSLLDSVKLGIPKELRTEVYRQILNGYYRYCTNEGFQDIYLHVQPPPDDGYVFCNRPVGQRIPTLEHLKTWYKNGFDSAISEGLLEGYLDFGEKFKKENSIDFTKVPICIVQNLKKVTEGKEDFGDHLVVTVKSNKPSKNPMKRDIDKEIKSNSNTLSLFGLTLHNHKALRFCCTICAMHSTKTLVARLLKDVNTSA